MILFSRLIAVYLIIIVVIWLSEGYFPGLQYKMSSNITQENIEVLKFGMDERKILKLLGKPYKKSQAFFYGSDYYFDYSKLAPFNSGITVRIGVKNHHLNKIWIGDDGFSAYECDAQKCPNIVNQCFYDKVIPIQ